MHQAILLCDSQFLKFYLILSHSANLTNFGECSYEVIKSTRTESLQEELGKICPVWLGMSVDVPTEPLKCFMFQIKGCKWEFIDIKSVMQTEILFYPINHPVGSSPLKRGKSSLGPWKLLDDENLVSVEDSGCHRLLMAKC